MMKILREKPRAEIKAVVYDLDATLLDTEENWFKTDRRVFSEYNIELTEEMKEKYVGLSIDDMIADLSLQFDLHAHTDEIYRKKNSYYLEIALGNTAMFPQMCDFYTKIKSLKYTTSIASGTAYPIIIKLLEDQNILDDFALILSTDHVANGKPAPDIYIETSKRLNIPVESLLVLEDSPYGVESALSAGCNCVAIPYIIKNSLDKIFYDADIICEGGMDDFSPDAVLHWMKG
jgi:beta-phosphoglucomutase-like phosphatase (HAD superfamily)